MGVFLFNGAGAKQAYYSQKKQNSRFGIFCSEQIPSSATLSPEKTRWLHYQSQSSVRTILPPSSGKADNK